MTDDEELKAFPHPLNQDIVEQIPVKKNRFDPVTQKVTSVYEMESRITRYIHVPKEKHRCKTGDHIFEVVDGGKGLFRCTLCPYYRKVYPTSYMFKSGKLINKTTGRAV